MTSVEELSAFYSRQLSVGSKVIGGVAGALATLGTTIPIIGAALSPVVAFALERVGSEIIARRLAPRQDARVGRTFVVAVAEIRDRRARGDTIRQDGYFEQHPNSARSKGDEITEAILLSAMNSFEERKVDFLGLLMANIAFDESISSATGILMTKMAEELSYRSLLLLKIIGSGEARGAGRRLGQEAVCAPPHVSALQIELYSLYTRGIIESKNSEHDLTMNAILSPDGVDPDNLYLSFFGRQLHDNLGLSRLPADCEELRETDETVKRLNWYGTRTSSIDGGTVDG